MVDLVLNADRGKIFRFDLQLFLVDRPSFDEDLGRSRHFGREVHDAEAAFFGDGFAFGFDRWAMVMAGAESLRDVTAFPKTQRGQDLLMDAPTVVDQDQLDELGLRVAKPRTDR